MTSAKYIEWAISSLNFQKTSKNHWVVGLWITLILLELFLFLITNFSIKLQFITGLLGDFSNSEQYIINEGLGKTLSWYKGHKFAQGSNILGHF